MPHPQDERQSESEGSSTESESPSTEAAGYLPPEPAGPEPELGGPPPQPEPAPAPQQPPDAPQQAPGWSPPNAGFPTGGPPPPQGWQPQTPPGWPQPPSQGWQQPPPPGWQPGPQPWAYTAAPSEPDNGPAVAGFVLAIVAVGLLFFSAGLSSIVSVGCAGFAIYYARQGRRRVDAGETPKHRNLAQAGFITGIVGLVLSLLATAFWLLILILALTSDEFRDDLEQEFEDSESISAAIAVGRVLARAASSLLV